MKDFNTIIGSTNYNVGINSFLLAYQSRWSTAQFFCVDNPFLTLNLH